ncbi:peptidoglycan-associated lipoprotein Pal [Alginatibacterium sediminis]|uniref:Peptidoglycan-associated lipoprotein n=1 Tax=Alginatibacterium sediminis TaxID=2164068 RepID=A0A420EG97_9ALTE|nr:peptidoglycan-associated lipoprotein Pal [Alginatibacterium sediminis]RKF19690.1 peptidoglycan-associated lipoprotein Pal [Alginatibacterium sediminis]
MISKINAKGSLVAASLLVLAACSNNQTTGEDSDVIVGGEDTAGYEQGGSGVETGSLEPILTPEEIERQKAEALRDNQVIYFSYDQSNIQGEFAQILEAHAEYLRNNPSVSVLIEGHTDERGTPDYNIALGEHRAKAVAKYLQSLGVIGSQISTVSYGEEKPVDFSHSESGMQQNRRAVLVY